MDRVIGSVEGEHGSWQTTRGDEPSRLARPCGGLWIECRPRAIGIIVTRLLLLYVDVSEWVAENSVQAVEHSGAWPIPGLTCVGRWATPEAIEACKYCNFHHIYITQPGCSQRCHPASRSKHTSRNSCQQLINHAGNRTAFVYAVLSALPRQRMRENSPGGQCTGSTARLTAPRVRKAAWTRVFPRHRPGPSPHSAILVHPAGTSGRNSLERMASRGHTDAVSSGRTIRKLMRRGQKWPVLPTAPLVAPTVRQPSTTADRRTTILLLRETVRPGSEN